MLEKDKPAENPPSQHSTPLEGDVTTMRDLQQMHFDNIPESFWRRRKLKQLKRMELDTIEGEFTTINKNPEAPNNS